MCHPYDDDRLSEQVNCGLAQHGTEVRAGRVRKLHAQHDRRETLGLHIVVTKLVEIPFAHVEGDAECRPHVRPSTAIHGDRCSALVTYPMNCFPTIAASVCEGGCEFIQTPMTALRLSAIPCAE